MNRLTIEDCDLIIDSLDYTIRVFNDYQYPTYEYKQARISEAKTTRQKVRDIRKRIKAGATNA